MTPGPAPAVLARYPEPCRPAGPVGPLGSGGGWSGSRLWRVPARAGPLVLRLWPVDGPGRAGLTRIHAWMIRASASLPFVPRPVAALDGSTAVEHAGHLWDLLPWLPGAARVDAPWTPGQVASGFAALGMFHAALPEAEPRPSPGIAARRDDLDRWLAGDLDRAAARLAPAGLDAASDLARAWIAGFGKRAGTVRDRLRAAAPIRVRARPCLRDARPDHFLFDGDRLAGLIDFGAMGVDTVASDLARLRADRPAPFRPDPGMALAAYRSARPLGDDEAGLIAVFEAANALLGAGRWVRWRFLEGRSFADPGAVEAGLRRGLDRLDGA